MRKARLIKRCDSCACGHGRCYAASDTACACARLTHIVQLISNVSEKFNNNMRPLYPDTVSLIVPNEALVGGVLGGSFIIIIMAVAAIGGMLAYRKKKLQAIVVIKSDSNL